MGRRALKTGTRLLEPFPGFQATSHPDLPLPQMLQSLPQLPWNQQTGKSQCALSLQDPPQGTMLAPALAVGGHPNSRRLAPNPQAQRLQLHLMRPSGLRLIGKCHLLSESRLCWPQPQPPQVSILCGQVGRALWTLTSQWLHVLRLSLPVGETRQGSGCWEVLPEYICPHQPWADSWVPCASG